MPKEPTIELIKAQGLVWLDGGRSALSGAMLDRFFSLDRLFAHWASALKAEECRVPPSARGETGGHAALSAAHGEALFSVARSATLGRVRAMTALVECARPVAQARPLERQSVFSVRQVVALGTAQEVEYFRTRLEERAASWCRQAELPVEWQPDAAVSAKACLVLKGKQTLASTVVYGGAIGKAFGITRAGEPAHAVSAAFGIERWLHALLFAFGLRRTDWPLTLRSKPRTAG